ncbi:hypothetical protein CRG98_042674 [Punica granatum]|uniref:Uncharacterized protein n=1 Tax=Punica granatum TaxID=22663 RepID=A0A2I0HZF1_PUNGR|nr:hypothetical protein CRG98_042674 [Punica granatum]
MATSEKVESGGRQAQGDWTGSKASARVFSKFIPSVGYYHGRGANACDFYLRARSSGGGTPTPDSRGLREISGRSLKSRVGPPSPNEPTPKLRSPAGFEPFGDVDQRMGPQSRSFRLIRGLKPLIGDPDFSIEVTGNHSGNRRPLWRAWSHRLAAPACESIRNSDLEPHVNLRARAADRRPRPFLQGRRYPRRTPATSMEGVFSIVEAWQMSLEHPMNNMKLIPRVDNEGVMREASFKWGGFAIGEQGEGKKSKI